MTNKRMRIIKKGTDKEGPIVYWMSRDQRAIDNWALINAQEQALQQRKPLLVIFCLTPTYHLATSRMYKFMLDGLLETADTLKKNNIMFLLLKGQPEIEVPKLLNNCEAKMLITEFDP